MADPEHERHAEMVEWRGPDFDPNAVDEAAIQRGSIGSRRAATQNLRKSLTAPIP
jgi:hypothetical protein